MKSPLAIGLALLPILPVTLVGQMTLPRDLEIEVARSALPAHLRDGATIYVLDSAVGFVVAQQGTNGFHALASRVDPAVFRGSWDYVEHFDDVLLPIAFDATGARTLLRPFLDAAALIASGLSPAEVKHELAAGFQDGAYPSPDRPGVAFMLSPILRAFPDPLGSDRRVTRSVPHRMFYAPNTTNADIGGSTHPDAATQPYVIQGGPWGYMVQRAGREERESIAEAHRGMLDRLCRLHDELCLDRSPQSPARD